MGSQIYSTHIEVDEGFMDFLNSVQIKPKNKYSAFELNLPTQLLNLNKPGIRLNIYQFHILILLTKSQNHQLSELDNDFFNNLSPFKDKMFIEFYVSGKSNGSLTPKLIEYECGTNKISIEAKKKIIKLFASFGIELNLQIEKRPKPVTIFLFD